MLLTWDEAKRTANLAKHGVDFAAAASFDWKSALVGGDIRHDYGESRFNAIGFIGARLHVLTYTPRAETLRIISLRKANARERFRYARWQEENP